jgi:hypothetical protein
MGSGLGADAPPRNDDGVNPNSVLTGQGGTKNISAQPRLSTQSGYRRAPSFVRRKSSSLRIVNLNGL